MQKSPLKLPRENFEHFGEKINRSFAALGKLSILLLRVGCPDGIIEGAF